MIKVGIRRYYLLQPTDRCPECGQPLNRVYRFHPFLLPNRFERGMWLKQDCDCVVKQQKYIRKQLEKVTIKQSNKPVLPPALKKHIFANFTVEKFNQDAFNVSVQFAKNFRKNKRGKGIIISGKAGRGKTHLACAIINYLQPRYSTAFAHIPTFLEQTRRGKGNLDIALTADLLVLDDLGSERESDWALEKLLVVVEGRLNRFKPIVYTTNYNLKDLELRIGSRLASRILYNSLDLVVQGPDWRQVRYHQAGK